MTTNRRQSDRKPFRSTLFNGVFFIVKDNGEKCEISHVDDVSTSGIGLQLRGRSFEKGDKLTFVHETDGLQMSVDATIQWCEQEPGDNASRIGLEFDPAQGDMNVLFVMALRDYLDAFEQSPLTEL